MANISLNRYQFPADEDFNGAATALHRLQDTYNVPAIEMAKAKLGKEDRGGLPLTSGSPSLASTDQHSLADNGFIFLFSQAQTVTKLVK